MKKIISSYSWIEILLVLAIILIIGRLIWIQKLAQLESSFFSLFGVSENIKYILTVPLFCLVLYGYYKSSARQVRGTGRKVIGLPVIIFAVGSLMIVALYFRSLVK